ncbi:MAG: hypothetical protein JWP63_1018 [Candidatus Solibacter sp.]|nr:hypothetical protein [Candidatus Solibacter sp.]
MQCVKRSMIEELEELWREKVKQAEARHAEDPTEENRDAWFQTFKIFANLILHRKIPPH